jgi:hypothetical protein
MSEMIERVAKVIWNIHSSSFNDGVGLDDDLMYLDMARPVSDIVERLRNTAVFIANATGKENSRWVNDAAEEIERLREVFNQIKTVCIDNEADTARHDLALKFVEKLADKALSQRGHFMGSPGKP